MGQRSVNEIFNYKSVSIVVYFKPFVKPKLLTKMFFHYVLSFLNDGPMCLQFKTLYVYLSLDNANHDIKINNRH